MVGCFEDFILEKTVLGPKILGFPDDCVLASFHHGRLLSIIAVPCQKIQKALFLQ